MRIPWPAAIGGALVAAVGVAGLVRGAQPEDLGGGVPGHAGTSSPPIVVSGAYVRAPAPPTDAAAAYFTVYDTTSKPDVLESVVSGAGQVAVLHTYSHGRMTVQPDGATVPAHGKLVLKVGAGHVMIEKLIGKLEPGQTVDLDLTFKNAGNISVTAPVVALGAPVPSDAGGS